MQVQVIVGLVAASVVVYLATPLAIGLAGRLEFFDTPAGYKGHARPTPYLGGAAVMAGFLVALAAAAGGDGRSAPLAVGIAVLWALGTLDDRRTVSPALRVVVEVALATGLWALHLGWDLGLGGAVDLAATALWVVIVLNAFNLFDNMDGASSSMVLAVSAGVAGLGVLRSDPFAAAAGAALAGACLGFLPHNLARPSARIFLGDGGSMPLGFAVAALVMTATADALPGWQALVAGLVLVGVPVLDTALVVVSRTRRGISILTGGRDHLTHRTRRRLGGARSVAAALAGAQVAVSALALVAIDSGSSVLVATVLLYLVAAGVAITLFEAADDQAQVALAAGTGTAARPRPSDPGRRPSTGAAVLVVVGLLAGGSAFGSGYYGSDLWLPGGLVLAALVGVAAIARPPRLGLPAGLALGGLAALAVVDLLSAAWGESVEQAVTEGNRTLVLAAVLALGLVLVRVERRATLVLAALGVGIAAVAAWVLARMLSGHLGDLFLGGRLNQPLGYINGEATVFAMGLWLCFAAVERRRPLVAGLGAAGATLLACLVVLSESRGAALAVLGGGLAVVALLPGRVRRIASLAVVGGAFALAAGPLVGVYDHGQAGTLTGATARSAALIALACAALAGAVWGGLTALEGAASPAARRDLRRAGQWGIAVALAVALLGGAALAGPIADRARTQYHAFVDLGDAGASGATTRLASGAGNRYDYWRVAWKAFGDHPVGGLGAGNYDRVYFADRRTSEDVRQPHSLELQVLSETGLLGFAALATFLVGLALAAVRTAAAARGSDRARAAGVAGVGGVTAWLVHTSVDWIHLLPGVTAIALLLASTLLLDRRPAAARAGVARGRLRPAIASSAAAALIVVAGASLTRQELAHVERDRALAALRDDRPALALRRADRSLRLDGDDVQTAYARAAAQARFGRGAAASQTLLGAAAREPSDFVTWTLLGDLAVRRGQPAAARAYYGRAHRLNPRDPTLTALTRGVRGAR